MLFVGLDLAWSTKNGTGVAVLKGDRTQAELLHSQIVFSDDDIISLVTSLVGKNPAMIAIDAPLIVPNLTGRRRAEELVGTLFRKYDAGAHPANRTRLSQWSGEVRGERIAQILEKKGFRHSPYVKRFEKSMKFFEVYPHPSMVVLFGLDRIIRYKAKPNRDYKERWSQFAKYQKCLRALRSSTPRLIIPDQLLKSVAGVRGKELKEYEDVLDAVFCAYIAYYCWHKPEECAVLGSMDEGYILTPVTRAMKAQINSAQNQRKLSQF